MSSDRERESCNSRHFAWLMKSCFPNPNDTIVKLSSPPQPHPNSPAAATTISSLPDDIVLDCLSRVPPSTLPTLSLVCRRWSLLLHSPDFSSLRRRRLLLRYTAVAIAATDMGLSAATLLDGAWNPSLFVPCHDALSLDNFHSLLAHARVASIGPRIYIIGRNAALQYDTWTATVSRRAAMIFPRKKFALSSVAGRIYVAGGGSKTSAVEEYDPVTDSWRVVSHAPRRRYGCVGASFDGVFYVIGGLRIGTGASEQNAFSRASRGAEVHAAYASSMDLFDVEARVWLRSRAVPGGGCVVAACAAVGRVFVLTSHAVELSFWSFHARRKCESGDRGGNVFGEWCRIKSPPLPVQVRVDTRMRFSCVGIGDKVVLIQSLNEVRGLREGFVLVYDCVAGEWGRGVDLPEVYRRAAYVGVES